MWGIWGYMAPQIHTRSQVRIWGRGGGGWAPDPQFWGPNCCPHCDSAAQCRQNLACPLPYTNPGSAPGSIWHLVKLCAHRLYDEIFWCWHMHIYIYGINKSNKCLAVLLNFVKWINEIFYTQKVYSKKHWENWHYSFATWNYNIRFSIFKLKQLCNCFHIFHLITGYSGIY